MVQCQSVKICFAYIPGEGTIIVTYISSIVLYSFQDIFSCIILFMLMLPLCYCEQVHFILEEAEAALYTGKDMSFGIMYLRFNSDFIFYYLVIMIYLLFSCFCAAVI